MVIFLRKTKGFPHREFHSRIYGKRNGFRYGFFAYFVKVVTNDKNSTGFIRVWRVHSRIAQTAVSSRRKPEFVNTPHPTHEHLINVMVFESFLVTFPKMSSKSSRNDKVYKGFASVIHSFRNHRFYQGISMFSTSRNHYFAEFSRQKCKFAFVR